VLAIEGGSKPANKINLFLVTLTMTVGDWRRFIGLVHTVREEIA